MISYEYPIIERIRTLLRLEDLHEKADHFLAGEDAASHHVTLITLFEIIEASSRADLKSDLIHELEKQKQTLEQLHGNPAVSETALDELLAEIESAAAALYAMQGKVGQHVRDNEWLMNIKQRTGIPGGVCEFDLPSYHYWLHLDAAIRRKNLEEWLAPIDPIKNGISIVLRLLRESGKSMQYVAHNGSFQQMLGGRAALMLAVTVADDVPCAPEISANKYAINIRFVTAESQQRPKACETDIPFTLTFYHI